MPDRPRLQNLFDAGARSLFRTGVDVTWQSVERRDAAGVAIGGVLVILGAVARLATNPEDRVIIAEHGSDGKIIDVDIIDSGEDHTP